MPPCWVSAARGARLFSMLRAAPAKCCQPSGMLSAATFGQRADVDAPASPATISSPMSLPIFIPGAEGVAVPGHSLSYFDVLL